MSATLRQRHAERTRLQVLDAAVHLFMSQGFDETTVEEIAAAVGISPRTFYRYFPSKESVLYHGVEARVAEIRQLIEARPADESPLEAVAAALCHVADTLADDPSRRALARRLIRQRPPSSRTHPRNTVWEQTERDVLAILAERTGLAPDDVGLRATLAAVGACFDVALDAWAASDDDSPAGPVLATALAAIGVRPPGAADPGRAGR